MLVIIPRCIRFRDLLGLDAGGLNHLRPFRDIGLNAAGEFFRRAVDEYAGRFNPNGPCAD